MIDGLFKARLDPLWEKAARPIARRFTANQTTLFGLGLVALACGAFHWHRSTPVFGLCLAFAFAADSLDGAVARIRNETSRFGGYLDAVIDRYQEAMVFLVLGLAGLSWAAAYLAFSGAMLTSYAKARVAIEIPVDNFAWPDLFERQERIFYICALLILTPGLASMFRLPDAAILNAGLWGLALLCHFTALQRFFRARRLLKQKDRLPATDNLPVDHA